VIELCTTDLGLFRGGIEHVASGVNLEPDHPPPEPGFASQASEEDC